MNKPAAFIPPRGLKFDYVGVIIGEDLCYVNVNGSIITDPFKRASTDKSLSGFKSMYKNNKDEALRIADQIIKNTYRTLMTRGMKGCYIYCVNPDLKEYFVRRMRKKNKVVYAPYLDISMKAAEQSVIYQTKSDKDGVKKP